MSPFFLLNISVKGKMLNLKGYSRANAHFSPELYIWIQK